LVDEFSAAHDDAVTICRSGNDYETLGIERLCANRTRLEFFGVDVSPDKRLAAISTDMASRLTITPIVDSPAGRSRLQAANADRCGGCDRKLHNGGLLLKRRPILRTRASSRRRRHLPQLHA
jgi:hypothetical protein